VTAGDLDGDGIADVISSSMLADGPYDNRLSCGEVYILFGAVALGGTYDMAGEAGPGPDVFIYGADAVDKLGSAIATGDINDDGTEDLLIGAYLADGAGDQKKNCGEIYGLWGGNFPPYIDLSVTPSNLFVIGQKANDHLGASVAAGDLDADGLVDLFMGAPTADGPGENRSNGGEVYGLYGSGFLAGARDLGDNPPNLTIYGAETDDKLGETIWTGDMNGDFISDLVVGSLNADGPSNSRTNAGESYVIYLNNCSPSNTMVNDLVVGISGDVPQGLPHFDPITKIYEDLVRIKNLDDSTESIRLPLRVLMQVLTPAEVYMENPDGGGRYPITGYWEYSKQKNESTPAGYIYDNDIDPGEWIARKWQIRNPDSVNFEFWADVVASCDTIPQGGKSARGNSAGRVTKLDVDRRLKEQSSIYLRTAPQGRLMEVTEPAGVENAIIYANLRQEAALIAKGFSLNEPAYLKNVTFASPTLEAGTTFEVVIYHDKRGEYTCPRLADRITTVTRVQSEREATSSVIVNLERENIYLQRGRLFVALRGINQSIKVAVDKSDSSPLSSLSVDGGETFLSLKEFPLLEGTPLIEVALSGPGGDLGPPLRFLERDR
jgi:hypothetical protein